jgi:ketosteroid isomerase-like protein
LLDRVQIEDMITGYYWDLTSEGRKNIASHWTSDAIFDVNGVAFKGHDEIRLMYAPDDSMGAPEGGHFNMLMNNPRIRVQGDTATVDAVFTGIISDTLDGAPRLYEQGIDHLELVKRDGRWLIHKRVLTSHAGLPKDFAKALEAIKQKGAKK